MSSAIRPRAAPRPGQHHPVPARASLTPARPGRASPLRDEVLFGIFDDDQFARARPRPGGCPRPGR
jgi:hypothetical protein